MQVSKGVYKATGSDEELGCSLSNAIERMGGIGNIAYLDRCSKSGKLKWQRVDIGTHKHYHGEQYRYLHHLMFITNSPLGDFGYKKLAKIVSVHSERIRDAMRSPTNKKYIPFSAQAMRYIHFKMQNSRYAADLDPSFTW